MTWEAYFEVARLIGGRYFVLAGIAFLLGYVLLRRKVASKKIQQRFPSGSDYAREIGYSTITIAIFAVVPFLLIRNQTVRPYTKFYTDIAQHGWIYFFAAFPIMLVLHDTYFYWKECGR